MDAHRRRGIGRVVLAAGLAVVLGQPAWGIINPRFTPADLVRTSARIFLLEVSQPEAKAVPAKVVETLKGKPFAGPELRLDLAEMGELSKEEAAAPLGGAKTAAAVLVLSRGDDKDDEDDAASGAIQINTLWFAVHRRKGKWCLAQDQRDLFAVWAGSAAMLAKAARYVQADPTARFPVRSDIDWGGDAALGKLAGPAAGCVVADLGTPNGLCVVVLSAGGDRVCRAASGEGKPSDVTAKVKLATASKLAAPGDFNGDGRIDLACWDGKALQVAAQGADGTFAAPAKVADLPDCLSLEAVDAGAAGAGLVAATGAGPVLLVPGAAGAFAARALGGAAGEGLGQAGPCVSADLDGDGRCDVLHVFEAGLVFYGGQGPGRFRAGAKSEMRLTRGPRLAVCGDYDADGLVDVVAAGGEGIVVLRGAGSGRWEVLTHITGELAYHGNANRPNVTGGAACDINNDGRQGVALFYAKRNAMLFFNRGFACFGLARELSLTGEGAIADPAQMPDPFAEPPPKLKAAEALQRGQAAGTVADLNGDGVEDMLAVDGDGQVWALFGSRREGPALGMTVALSPKARGPLTVTVQGSRRLEGTHVVRPGVPAFVGREQPGPVTLKWAAPGGEARSRRVIVTRLTRVELAP